MTLDPFNWLRAPAAADGLDTQERIAIATPDRAITYGALAERVEATARALAARGLGPGARLALRGTNTVETIVVLLAAARLGVAVAPLHPRLTEGEVAGLLDDLRPDLVLDDTGARELASAALAFGDEARLPHVQADADLALVHTSGTTARPKIARLSRAAFVASAAGSARNLGWRDDDRWLLCLPVCHVGGLSVVTRCVGAGATIVLLPKFDPAAVLDAIARHRATLLSVVPTMLRALLDEDRGSVLSRLRAVLVGGASTPMAWLEECEERRVVALATYGLTEACSQVTTQAPPPDGEPYRAQPGCGRPLAGVEVRVADDAGEPADTGRSGHILVRGATTMRGYLGQAPLVFGAWLQTGDVGTFDDRGCLHVEARRSDMIVTGGENVSPAEVERALVAAGAREALVFGVPDERWGQIVGALVVAAERLEPATLAAELKGRLAPHGRPRRWAQVEALPVNRAGKVDRAEAVARYGPSLLPLSYR